jgi:hypothetical protein
VFNSSFYRVGGESCAQSLSKARHTFAIISGMAEQLPNYRLNHDAADCDLAKGGLFPVLLIRVRIVLRLHNCGIGDGQ